MQTTPDVQIVKTIHYLSCTRIFCAIALATLAWTGSAATLYVSLASTNSVSPYDDWNRAATNIQDAVDFAVPGDEVVVMDGVYTNGGRAVGTNIIVNRVAVDRPITLRSVNGPEFTVIQGYQVPGVTNGDGALRCVYLTNGASLLGFTLTKGATRAVTGPSSIDESSGGGVWCTSSSASTVVSNCVLSGNSAQASGGAAFMGFLKTCLVMSNSAGGGGGLSQSSATNCLLCGNSALTYGGGAANCGNLVNCTLLQNAAAYGGGAYNSSLAGCLVVSNRATQYGGGLYSPLFYVENCTITGNSAFQGGGLSGGGFPMVNNLIYYNSATYNPNYFSGTFLYCCTTPLPSGSGHIDKEPLFLDTAGGDYRLQGQSPCINAGRNRYVVRTRDDLDGNPRITNGTVDIGAYEFQGSGSLISYAWLQQYGWPTDGSVDLLDYDGDGMNNWQEWVAGTNATNAPSVLTMLTPTGSVSGVTVSWQSVTDRSYWLERATNFTSSPFFRTVRSNIFGQSGTTTYTDTKATNAGPFFYRVGVVGP
jgi:hypothetical protein